jgi:serine/threonine-protein kinase RsbT
MELTLSKEAPNIISIRSDMDIVAARMAARTAARKMGFHTIDQARIAATTSELTRNILTYATEGTVTIQEIHAANRHGIEIIFEDKGPGITNISQFLERNNYQRADKGFGLSGSRRLMDNMEIVTTTGVGTRIICQKWLR